MRASLIFLLVSTLKAPANLIIAAPDGPLCVRDVGEAVELLAANHSLAIVATPEAKRIHAIDLMTCEVTWTVPTVGAAGGSFAFGDYFAVEGTSVLDSESAYVTSVAPDEDAPYGTVTVASFDLDSGDLNWSYSFPDVVGKLSLNEGRLFVLGESNLVAIDSKTGTVHWIEQITYSGVSWMPELNVQFSAGLVAYFTGYDADPSIVGPPPYDLPSNDDIAAIVALDPVSGRRIWTSHFPQTNYFWLSATADETGFVFVGSQMYRRNDEDHKVIRLNATDGSRVWEQDIEETFEVLNNDIQVAVFDADPDHELSDIEVFDCGSGERQFVRPVDDEAWPVLLTNDYVLLEYFWGDDLDQVEPRTFVALSLKNWGELWSVTPQGEAKYGEMQLAVREDAIYTMIGNTLTAIDPIIGTVAWDYQFDASGKQSKLLLTPTTIVVAHAGSMISIFET
jgi:outer membrane protein assembly factor BamB